MNESSATVCHLCGQRSLYIDFPWSCDAAGFYECDACLDAMTAYFEERYPELVDTGEG